MEFGVRYYRFSATLFKSVWIAEASLPPAMAMSGLPPPRTCYDRGARTLIKLPACTST